MKEPWKDALKIEDALIRHHRQAEPEEVPPFLANKVMARLRGEMEPGMRDFANGSRIGGVVWRFAAVTSLIAVLLGAYGKEAELQMQVQFAEIMVDDASNLDFVQDLGVL